MTEGTLTVYDCGTCGAPVYRDVVREWKHMRGSNPCTDVRPVPVPFIAPTRDRT